MPQPLDSGPPSVGAPMQPLYSWFQGALGRSVLDAELERLKVLLPDLYGPIAVQLGATGPDPLKTCDAVMSIHAPPLGVMSRTEIDLTTCPEALPFDTKSVGLVMLPHVLEFSAVPHQVLREVARVLVPEGHVVIVGFNPLSMWGLRRVLSFTDMPPWQGRFYRLHRVKDWLALLGFEIVSGEMLYYRPPLNSNRVRDKLAFLERAGDRWWPLLAAVYVLVGRKRELGVTPLLPKRLHKRSLVPGLAEPVVRNGFPKESCSVHTPYPKLSKQYCHHDG